MRRFCIYTRLQMRRAARYAPFVLLVTLILCLSLTLALLSIVNTKNNSASDTKIGIGIVGDFENGYLQFGVSALKSFDSSRYFLDVLALSEEEAMEMLLAGKINGYVVIPNSFISDAMHGRINELNFITTGTNIGLIDMFKQEVLDLVSCILVESQKGVFGMEDAMRERGFSYGEIMDMSEELCLTYVDLIVDRSKAIKLEVIGVSDNLTFGGYMFSGFFILLMLLSGIAYCPLYICRDSAFPKLLRASRFGAGGQIAGEYLSFFSLAAVNTTALLGLLTAGFSRMPQGIPELSGKDTAEILSILVQFIPAIALITALQYLLYQLSDALVSGVLIQFVSAVILGYVSGCFYPISFFPKAIRIASAFLPSGMARGYLSSVITDTVSLRQIVSIVLYTAIMLALSALIRYRRITEA